MKWAIFFQMDSNYFLLFFRSDSSFIIASRDFIRFQENTFSWTSKDWLLQKEKEWNVKYESDSWSALGVIIQVANEKGDLDDTLIKAKELRFTLHVSVSDMLGYFSRYKFPHVRNIVPSVSSL